jgi:thiosulfate/3-mercaptopyruvate sulfurtransferase
MIRTVLAILIVASLAVAAATWAPQDLIQPSAVAAKLKESDAKKPLILQIGFQTLYRSSHLPGAEYAGPASNPAGIEAIKKAVANVAKDREIIIYCGCCPWDHCPNMKPAFDLLKGLGFKNFKAIMIADNLEADWIKKGYPIISLNNGQ